MKKLRKFYFLGSGALKIGEAGELIIPVLKLPKLSSKEGIELNHKIPILLRSNSPEFFAKIIIFYSNSILL